VSRSGEHRFRGPAAGSFVCSLERHALAEVRDVPALQFLQSALIRHFRGYAAGANAVKSVHLMGFQSGWLIEAVFLPVETASAMSGFVRFSLPIARAVRAL
jgi:hypothetical protein